MLSRPDQIAIALAAFGQLEEENQQLDRQWTLRRERARYEAERARRQYDAVEPENRLVARSLERAWEDKLRAVETIEQEYARWRSEDRWSSARQTERAADAGREPAADLARRHHIGGRSKAHSAFCHARSRPRPEADEVRYGSRSCGRRARSASIVCSDASIPTATTSTSSGCGNELPSSTAPAKWTRRSPRYSTRKALSRRAAVHSKERTSGCCEHAGAFQPSRSTVSAPNPIRWPDGSFSVQGAAAALGITSQTVFDYLERGLLSGRQLTKGQPWQIDLTDEQIDRLRARVRRTRRSKKEAS